MIKSGSTILAADLVQSITAGEALTANDAVYISTSDGKAYKCDADDQTKMDFVGFAQQTVLINVAVNIVHRNQMTGLSGMTIGAVYYLSGTAGAITATAPTNRKIVGVALTATVLKIVDFPSVRFVPFTASGTWTKYPGLKYIRVRLVAGGGGGGGGGSGATAGGTTSFGSHCQATGGQPDGGSPGVGSGGDINLYGNPPGKAAGVSGAAGANGGGSVFGGGGPAGSQPGTQYGGGGGGGNNTSSGNTGADGGAGGGYSEKIIMANVLGATETVTVGAGGAADSAGSTNPGGVGYQGVVFVEEYY